MTQRTPNVHFGGPRHFKQHRNPREGAERESTKSEISGGRKKARNFGPPPFGAPPLWSLPFSGPQFFWVWSLPPSDPFRAPPLWAPHVLTLTFSGFGRSAFGCPAFGAPTALRWTTLFCCCFCNCFAALAAVCAAFVFKMCVLLFLLLLLFVLLFLVFVLLFVAVCAAVADFAAACPLFVPRLRCLC